MHKDAYRSILIAAQKQNKKKPFTQKLFIFSYTEKYKTLMKERKEDLNKWKYIPFF